MGRGKSMTTMSSETLKQPATQSQKALWGEWFNPFAFFIYRARKICYPKNSLIQ